MLKYVSLLALLALLLGVAQTAPAGSQGSIRLEVTAASEVSGVDPCEGLQALTIDQGDVVRFCYTLFNDSPSTITSVTLDPDLFNEFAESFEFNGLSIAPNTSHSFTTVGKGSFAIDVDETTNTLTCATAVGILPIIEEGSKLVPVVEYGPVCDDVQITVGEEEIRELSVQVTIGTTQGECSGQHIANVDPGATVYTCYTVTNHGNVPLVRHTLMDSRLGLIFEDLEFVLEPGESLSTTELDIETSDVITVNSEFLATWIGQAESGFEAGDGSVAYAVVNTTGTLSFEFEGSPQGWTYVPGATINPAFTNPTGDVGPTALEIAATNNQSNYGYWQSPGIRVRDITDPAVIDKEAPPQSIIQAIFRVTSNQTESAQTPRIRVRATDNDAQVSAVLDVESNGLASFSPNIGDSVDLTLTFQTYPLQDSFVLAFEMLNLQGFDAATGEIGLDQVVLREVDYPSTYTTELTFDFENGAQGWTQVTVDGQVPVLNMTLLAPQFSTELGALGLAPSTQAGTTFGFWAGPETGNSVVRPVAGRVYAAIAQVSTDTEDPTEVNGFRLRTNDSQFRVSQYLDIASGGAATAVPSAGSPREYFLFAPEGAGVGGSLLWAFDILTNPAALNKDPDGTVYLDSLQIISFEP